MKGKATFWTYIKNYKFNSIFIKNFVVILLLLMVSLLCVHYLVYLYNDSTMKEEVSRSSLSELIRIRDTVDIIMAEAESLSIRLGSDSNVAFFLREDSIEYPLSYAIIERIRKVQDLLRILALTNPYIKNIQIYSGRSHYLLTVANGGHLDKHDHEWWYKDYLDKKDKSKYWISTLVPPGDGLSEVILFRQLPVSSKIQDSLLLIGIGAAQLDPLLKENTPEQEIYILDQDGRIVYTPNQVRIHQSIEVYQPDWSAPLPGKTHSEVIYSGGRAHIVSMAPSSGREWTYLSIVPLEMYESSQSQFRSFIILLVVSGIVSSLIIAFIISVKTYQPIHGILSLLENPYPSGWEAKNKASGSLNEMKFIAATIIQSREQKEELEKELELRYEMMSKAQAIALQAQINPHMLYNTLEAVNWKVMRLTNGKNEASTMIHALSRLLRLSLSTGSNIISLREELEHARLYVEVQQMHYKDELEINWKINGNILDYMTVKLTLQPIIENAIYHGIKPSGRGGVISIIGYEEIQAVVLRMKDNGVGMDMFQVEKINQSFNLNQIKESDHIGLSNVNQRIKLVFGEPYGLKVFGKEGGGTIVEMRLPKRK